MSTPQGRDINNTARLAQIRAHIDLPVLKRAAGLLEGYHRSIFKGHGQDFDDLSLYSPGDDVSDIDWKSSARAGIPIIRRFQQQSNLSVVLVTDIGRNMAAVSSGGVPKGDTAVFLASLVAYVARDRGDRVALVAGDSERLIHRPPRASTQDLEVMLAQLTTLFSVDAPAGDISIPIKRTLSLFHRRCLVILITDETRPAPEHEELLRHLKVRHEVLVLQVSDASPFVGARLGDGHTVRDVDRSLNLPPFLSKRLNIQSEAADYVRQRRAQSVELLQRNGIVNVVIDSSQDAIVRFTAAVRRQKHLS
ncbi:DUF58 domain-containing protein [Jonesia quinghaiensis]|uniref:DUF58 domain-containing protein n=1 Tax=Jonesia quinghaiensis TaxID=262806 RepID=UPI0003F6A6CA|nr:DUF58 domain-containing protein [Jonesia quinghaiensis]